MANLKSLKVIDLGKNAIDFTLQQFYHFIIKPLQKLPKLEYVSFQDNPVEVKIIKCKFLCICDLPKIKYYDWKLITKEDKNLAKKYESQGKWKEKENKPEPINASKGPKITGGSFSINLPTINLPQENKTQSVTKEENKKSEEHDKRISQLVGTNDSLVNFLLGNDNDPINDIVSELNDNSHRESQSNDPLSMYLEVGDGGHDPLAEIINYLEEQPDEKEDSKIKSDGNYEEDLLKIIYGDSYSTSEKKDDVSFSDVDDIFSQISNELDSKSKGAENTKKTENTKPSGQESDLDDLLNSITNDIEKEETPGESNFFNDIDQILNSGGGSSGVVVDSGDNDEALEFLLQGAIEQQEKNKIDEERETLKRETIRVQEMLQLEKKKLQEEKENEQKRMKEEKEKLEQERLKMEQERERIKKEREQQLLEQKQKLEEERKQFEEEQRRLFEEQRLKLEEEQKQQLLKQKQQLEEEQKRILEEQKRKMEEEIEIKRKEIEEAKKLKLQSQALKEQEEQERLRKEREIELNKMLQQQEEEEKERLLEMERQQIEEQERLEEEQRKQREILEQQQQELEIETKKKLEEKEKELNNFANEDDEVMSLLNTMLESSENTEQTEQEQPDEDDFEEQANEVLNMLENEEKSKPVKVVRGLQRGTVTNRDSAGIKSAPQKFPPKKTQNSTPPVKRGMQRSTQVNNFSSTPSFNNGEEEGDGLLSTGDDELDNLLSNKPSSSKSSLMNNVKFTELQFSQRLGVGTFGTSFRGFCRNKEISVKKLKVQRFADHFVQQFLNEANALANIKHENLVPFYGVCADNTLCTIFQFIRGVNLYGFLRQKGNSVDFKFIVSISRQIASAVHFLHSHEILHRNLCSKNILLNNQSQVFLSDYGFPFIKANTYQTAMGYPEYESPEVLEKSQNLTPAVDVYSFGILVWELFSRESPYTGLSPMQIKNSVIQTELRPSVPIDSPFVFQKLMNACWNTDPQARPSMEMITKILSRSVEELGKFAQVQNENQQPQEGQGVKPELSEEEATQRISVIVEKVLALLQRNDVPTQQKALSAIVNLAKTYSEHLSHMAELVPFIVDKISVSGDSRTNELACEVLNLLGENEECSTEFRESVGFPALLELLSSGEIQVIIRALKTITTLLKQEENKEAIRYVGGIVPLMKLMRVKNEFIKGFIFFFF